MKKWWCLFLAVLLASSLAACSAKAPETTEETQTAETGSIDYSGQQTAKPNPDDTFAATYQIVRIETVTGEGSADEETMQDIRDRGYRTLLVLQEDGTGVMNNQTSQMTLYEDGSLVIRDKAGTMYLELMH